MVTGKGRGFPRAGDPRRDEMKTPDDVSAMVRLKAYRGLRAKPKFEGRVRSRSSRSRGIRPYALR